MQISEYNVHDPDVVLMNNNLPCITKFQNRVFRFVSSTKCVTLAYMIFSSMVSKSIFHLVIKWAN